MGSLDKTRVVVIMAAGLCAGGAALALLAAFDIAAFLTGLDASKLAKPPRTTSLITLLPVLGLLGLLLLLVGWRALQSSSPVRQELARWSPMFVLLWGAVIGYLMLVNYPVPPQVHHTDRFLVVCLLGLLAGGWLAFHPQSVGSVLRGRLSTWVRVGLVNLLVFVVTGELVCRLADPMLARSGLFGDKHTPANLTPHMLVRGSIGVSNSQGFRDRERTIQRTSSAPRVVALGDSFTWGAGVSYDEAFVTLLEQSLQAVTPGAEIINLGIPAWGPYEERHLLEVYGIRFSPDLVLLNFFIGNDIQNKRGDDLNLSDILVVAGQSFYVHSNGNWVHDSLGPERWYLYHDLDYLWRLGMARMLTAIEARTTGQSAPGMASDWAPLVSRNQYLKGIHERSEIYLKESTPFFAHHWGRTRSIVLAIRNFLRQRDILLLVVLIPDQVQLDRELQREYLATFGESPDRYDFAKPQRLLHTWCGENGIELIDLMPAFEAVGDTSKLHFRNDIHWSVAGHRLAAATTLPALQRLLMRRAVTQAGARPLSSRTR